MKRIKTLQAKLNKRLKQRKANKWFPIHLKEK